jgi:prepilin-type N-terminal cleavage/methylation domain-containing protein
MNRKSSGGFTLIELMIVIVIIGIFAAIAIPNFMSMQDRAKEAKVKAVAHTLFLAADDFGVRHDRVYSDSKVDLLPLLPDGKMLENAFTGDFTEPRFGAVATEPGQVAIVAVMRDGVAVGYTITAYGKEANILTLDSRD